ncbi:hypothetical protein EYE40_10815 [Glaciihabitans arcticus]|uniref:Uncharacterized protein n=1 Tax=Glaciihabitans arcticus TaxID=2668039 RepID=A0A4Q9GT20_9MICO|nr:hypothetical protein [Glaciihabitans arcticus]TBN57841.1 hypothetical protein EYE40_10815 [Glaciihabitans arcticus]
MATHTPEPTEDDSEPVIATIDETGQVEAVPDSQVAVVDSSYIDAPDAPAPAPGPQIVYVTEPSAPVRKGNRGLGSLIAVGAALVYGVLLAIVFLIYASAVVGRPTFSLLASPALLIPILLFAVALVLLVLIVNRAGWWSYVFGSVLVALAVYFGTAGALALASGIVLETPEGASRLYGELLLNPPVIIAALLAREVAVWAGAIIGSRGRRVRTRNAEARAAFDAEKAARRAQA